MTYTIDYSKEAGHQAISCLVYIPDFSVASRFDSVRTVPFELTLTSLKSLFLVHQMTTAVPLVATMSIEPLAPMVS
jgi:hypothetical protein